MPPLPAANKVLRVAFRQTVEGQDNLNIMHFTYSGAGANQTDLNNLTDGLGAGIKALMQNLQSADNVYQDVTAIDLTSSTALTSTRALTGVGSHTGGASPASMACAISWKVHRRYRGGHPRTYVGGLPITTLSTERSFSATFVALAKGNAAAFLAGFPLASGGAYGNINPVSLSYFSGGAVRVTPITDDIIGSDVNARPDSQRRRLGKVAG